ncbi:MAG: PD40 domain-containing protein, partial [Acidobacteria bacterium]|nr:PD40 domain-containing protein [Acidobacteriota bacterium]
MLPRPVTRSVLALSLLALPLAAAEPPHPAHPFTVQDLVALERISDAQASPAGDRIVFTLRSTDLDANKGRTDLWLVSANGEGLRRLTDDPAADNNARWASDGRTLFFLSTRGGSSQVWRLDVDGDAAPA